MGVSLIEELHEELKVHTGKDIKLPLPRSEFLEMHRIFEAEGFNMSPIVYLGGSKIAYALLDRSFRPDYDGGKQLFKDDGYVPILEKGRESGKIKITHETRSVPAKSRFGVSWNEIHNLVVQEVAKVSPQLTKAIEATAAVLRVPTKENFRFAEKLRYAHFGTANTWEWLYNDFGVGCRLIGGAPGDGGLGAVIGTHPAFHYGHVAFRLEVVTPFQKA